MWTFLKLKHQQIFSRTDPPPQLLPTSTISKRNVKRASVGLRTKQKTFLFPSPFHWRGAGRGGGCPPRVWCFNRENERKWVAWPGVGPFVPPVCHMFLTRFSPIRKPCGPRVAPCVSRLSPVRSWRDTNWRGGHTNELFRGRTHNLVSRGRNHKLL